MNLNSLWILTVPCLWLAFFVPGAFAKPLVLVSVEPVALVVREVCGDQCEVMTLVPRGVSEHSWQPGPKDIIKAKSAVAAIAVGLDFDNKWLKNLLVPSSKTLWLGPSLSPMDWWSDDMSAGVSSPKIAHDHGHLNHKGKSEPDREHGDHDHNHGSKDPHIWTDAGRMGKAAGLSADHLSALMPESAQGFKSRGKTISDRLIKLQLDVESRRQFWRTRPVVVFHDVVGYFARRFNLPVLAVETGASGHDLSAKMIADVSNRFKNSHPAVVMVERVDGAAKSLARELKTTVKQVDFAASGTYQNWDEWYLRLVQAWEDVLKSEGGR